MKFKKLMLVVGSALLLQNPAAQASSRIGEAIFTCVYFVCPAILAQVTGIHWIIEMKGRNKASQTILEAGDDAAFFKSHVMEAQPGEYADDIYSKLFIRVSPDDVLTYEARVKHTSSDSSYYYQDQDTPLAADQTQPILIESMKIHGVKINGRYLISDKLVKAHLAARDLIYNHVLKVEPTQQVPGHERNALLLNELVVKANQQK